jgi:hypothetical protein
LISTTEVYAEAKKRHGVDPSKCFQRHIRDVYTEVDPREPITSLDGCRVEQISKAEAEALILQYEWLGNCGRGASAFYGLKSRDDELLGVAIFGVGTSQQARNICGRESIPLAVSLMRGCCVHFAPKNAPSFLIRWATEHAYEDHGWKIFIAYADSDAGEIGSVYQAVGWHYIGEGLGRPKGNVHLNWRKPDGTEISSQTVHRRNLTKRDCLAMGYQAVPVKPKKKYVWFEGTADEVKHFKSRCRYPFQPYPKRMQAATNIDDRPAAVSSHPTS